MKQARNRIIYFIQVGFFILIIGGALSFIWINRNIPNLDGKFYSLGYPEDTSYYDFTPDKDDYTNGFYCLESDTNEDDDSYETKFGYQFEDSKVIMDGETVYTFYKNYLIPEEYTYSGYVPDEDTFDVVCEYISETGFGEEIKFNKDGTLESTYYDEEEVLKSSGNYERSGNIITCDYGDSWPSRYLVYKNQINNSVLYRRH